MKPFIPIFLMTILFTVKATGQRYTGKLLCNKADSVVRSFISEKDFKKYIHSDTATYALYQYDRATGNDLVILPLSQDTIMGYLLWAMVEYKFSAGAFKTTLFVKFGWFDQRLVISTNVSEHTIPGCVKNDRRCKMISPAVAQAKGIKAWEKKTTEGDTTCIAGYSNNFKRFAYRVEHTYETGSRHGPVHHHLAWCGSGIIPETPTPVSKSDIDEYNSCTQPNQYAYSDYIRKEVVEVDALTGELLSKPYTREHTFWGEHDMWVY